MRRLTVVASALALVASTAACNGDRPEPVERIALRRIVSTPVPTPSPSPSPVPKRAVRRSPTGHSASSGRAPRYEGVVPQPWQSLADCESGDRYMEDGRIHIVPNTARWHIEGLHSGGLQFAYDTWRRAGGTRFAPTAGAATPMQQVEIAKAWLARTSWAQWPNCSRILGLR